MARSPGTHKGTSIRRDEDPRESVPSGLPAFESRGEKAAQECRVGDYTRNDSEMSMENDASTRKSRMEEV